MTVWVRARGRRPVGLRTLALALSCLGLATPVSAEAATGTAASLGVYHTCALTSAGGVECWGANESGQLGDGTTATSNTPVAVQGLTGVTAISAGGEHTCALTSAGGVECWGANESGQLGDGTNASSNTPVAVQGLTGVTAITAGGQDTCALTSAGSVECWGASNYGQLGDGSTTNSTIPVGVSGLASGVIAISAGWDHTCALTNAGAVDCWGHNELGQLGDGLSEGPDKCFRRTVMAATDVGCSLVPVSVSGLSGVRAISAGWDHTCALTSAGGVQCWGRNESGQLGDATSTGPEQCEEETGLYYTLTSCSTTPVGVSGASSGVSTIAAGGEHGCALTSAGGSECWGRNNSGQLGDGTSAGPEQCEELIVVERKRVPFACSTTPLAVSGLGPGIAAIGAGGYHTCALTDAGGVKCWGANNDGQLGNGTSSGPKECGSSSSPQACSTTPVRVSGLTHVTCSAATGTITLSPGLTDTAAYQSVKFKGTLTGCIGERFTQATYAATLTTTGKATCAVLSGADSATTFGSARWLWMPKTKASTGTLGVPLTEAAGIAFGGELESGPYSPLTLSATIVESYTNAGTCGVPRGRNRVITPVTKGVFNGSEVSFE